MIMKDCLILYNLEMSILIRHLQRPKACVTPVHGAFTACSTPVHNFIHSFLHSFSALSRQGSQQVHIILTNAPLRLT